MNDDLTVSPAVLKLVTWSVALASLTKPTNLALWIVMWLQLVALKKLQLSSHLQDLVLIAMQHVSFFAFGGSNSLAT